jgi:hypothetical protein
MKGGSGLCRCLTDFSGQTDVKHDGGATGLMEFHT